MEVISLSELVTGVHFPKDLGQDAVDHRPGMLRLIVDSNRVVGDCRLEDRCAFP